MDSEITDLQQSSLDMEHAHLLKYDSSQGKYALADTVKATDDSIIVDGKEIKIYAKANAEELPWGEIGVDVVLECTGFYTSKEKASAHIKAGARKVVISAPAGNDLPTIVYNVNHETLKPEDTVISAASCTTNCLAPMAKALNDLAPIESGIMCTIHAYTGDQMTHVCHHDALPARVLLSSLSRQCSQKVVDSLRVTGVLHHIAS